MYRSVLGGVAALALSLAASAAGATTITFDDINISGGGGVAIPNGYAGLNWTDISVIEAALGGAGYVNGMVSTPNVAYGGYDSKYGEFASSFSSASGFTLNSLYLTAAFRNGLNVAINGLSGGKVVDSIVEVVNTTGPSDVVLNWSGIDEVEFAPSGGTPAFGGGAQFVLDNLTITAAPEPATWAMLILGVAMIGFALRRGRDGLAVAT